MRIARRHSWLANPWLHVALILAIAAFFRLWQIDAIPPGLFGDEATDGLDALDVLAGRGAVFFPANFGREGLHMWIVAGMFRLLGVTPLALRLPSIVAGVLTALVTYWLGRELALNIRPTTTDDRRWSAVADLRSVVSGRRSAVSGRRSAVVGRRSAVVGRRSFHHIIPLLAALYVATSFWHVHFSRFGIRGVFTPLFGALAFAAFWRGANDRSENGKWANGKWANDKWANGKWQMGKWANDKWANDKSANGKWANDKWANGKSARSLGYVWFGVSGLCLGLATHFYTASRFFPLFLGGFLLLQALIAYARGRRDEAILRRCFWGIVLLYAVAAVIFAPLGIYFLQHPGSFAQRAGEVIAFGDANPWARVGQAVLANVAQFFLPGKGDMAQFYNLPGRAVFDPLTAILALVGIAALLWRWREPAALFLLIWFPALLLPSFLATDRFPTLPRVLGVIPGVYFFPAVGMGVIVEWVVRGGRTWEGTEGAEGKKETGAAKERAPQPRRALSPGHLVTLSLVMTVALFIHAGLTYRDYFRVWGPSQATFDAFEGDMTAAWQWLQANEPAGHVYLSSDIYRHPTFMLLGERATVTTYFEHHDPDLSWFDARTALPLPAPGQAATYLLAANARPRPQAADLLATFATERARILGPDGTPALTVFEAVADTWYPVVTQETRFTEFLSLTDAACQSLADGTVVLRLVWRARGREAANWRGYRLQIALGAEPGEIPFDGFRPPEWVAGASFITWHVLDAPSTPDSGLLDEIGLRLIRSDGEGPVVDHWHQVACAR